LLHVPEVAQASGGSRREEAIPNELYPDEGTHDDGPRPEENSDSDPDQPEPAQENMEDGSFPKLSARQKKWMELRAKMVLNDENYCVYNFYLFIGIKLRSLLSFPASKKPKNVIKLK
jgi:hypothetical protein